MSETHPHYAQFNSVFAAPSDEPLRLVGTNAIICTDQQQEDGKMWLSYQLNAADTPIHHPVGITPDGLLFFEYGSFRPEAEDWIGLAKNIESAHPALGMYGIALAALFRQVGGDPAYKNLYVLQLNSPRGVAISL